MSNYVMLIGRLVNEPTIDSDTKNCGITIAITRSYKNEEGIYDTDYISVKLTGNIATNVVDYCKKGDLIAIKGSLSRTSEIGPMRIVADKVTFLASQK